MSIQCTIAQKSAVDMSIDSILKIAVDSLQENVALSRYHAELGLEIAQKAKSTRSIIKSYAILSDCYYQRNDLEAALKYSETAAQLSLQSDRYILDYVYLNQGYILCMLDQCERGLELLTEAERIAKSEESYLSLFKCIINKGLIYQTIGAEDSAIHCFRSAIALHEKHPSDQVAVCYNNIGNYFEEKASLDSAFHYYQKALEANENSNDYNLGTIILYGLASVSATHKDFVKAMMYTDSSLVLSKNISFVAGIKDAVKMKAHILHLQGRTQDAYFLLDSLDVLLENTNSSQLDIEKKFDALDEFQNQENRHIGQENLSRNIILIFILAILLLLLFIYRKNLPFIKK